MLFVGQLTEIKKNTLAGVICNNYDLNSITTNPFYASTATGFKNLFIFIIFIIGFNLILELF